MFLRNITARLITISGAQNVVTDEKTGTVTSVTPGETYSFPPASDPIEIPDSFADSAFLKTLLAENYLVKVTAPDTTDVEPGTGSSDALSAMKKDDLIAYAKGLGLDVNATFNKEQLVSAILKAQDADA